MFFVKEIFIDVSDRHVSYNFLIFIKYICCNLTVIVISISISILIFYLYFRFPSKSVIQSQIQMTNRCKCKTQSSLLYKKRGKRGQNGSSVLQFEGEAENKIFFFIFPLL